MTSGSHGKPYAGWTLPDGTGSDIQSVNRRVMEQVSTRVHDILEWLIPNLAKRVSDEHYSTDPSEDEWDRSLSPSAPSRDAAIQGTAYLTFTLLPNSTYNIEGFFYTVPGCSTFSNLSQLYSLSFLLL
jgi:hypothetical protein